LKPSEKDPGAAMFLAELEMEAGLTAGVLNVVHGTHGVVNHICDDPNIKAVSFVGSNMAGMHIYARTSTKGKRVQGAIIMPNANIDVKKLYRLPSARSVW
jgi:malonate-semialdehyde dehydrogenase (acetylating)/methylmalonate-semialdehyde dehydrogenase